jgi:hypothetical protein
MEKCASIHFKAWFDSDYFELPFTLISDGVIINFL